MPRDAERREDLSRRKLKGRASDRGNPASVKESSPASAREDNPASVREDNQAQIKGEGSPAYLTSVPITPWANVHFPRNDVRIVATSYRTDRSIPIASQDFSTCPQTIIL